MIATVQVADLGPVDTSSGSAPAEPE